MGKKRKSVASRLDEVDRTMYTTFCSAANSLSQLYTQTMNQQKLSFLAGERHGLEKLYQWMLRQEEGASRASTIDIISYLQSELDFCGDDPSLSPRVSIQYPHSQPVTHFTNSSYVASSAVSGPTNTGQVNYQSKNSVFSNALSSPVRQSLQNYHFNETGYNLNGSRNPEPNPARDANGSNDSSMEMHADSPDHGPQY